MEEPRQEIIDFILDIDWLNTKEFCKKYNVPEPIFTKETNYNVAELFRIDAVKWKMVMEKAKEIRRAKNEQ